MSEFTRQLCSNHSKQITAWLKLYFYNVQKSMDMKGNKEAYSVYSSSKRRMGKELDHHVEGMTPLHHTGKGKMLSLCVSLQYEDCVQSHNQHNLHQNSAIRLKGIFREVSC